VEARVFLGVRLTRGDLAFLRREDLSELGELRLRDALGREGRDRGLDETPELDDVRERMAARDEAGKRTRQIVRRCLTNEGATAGSRFDDPEELQRAQRLSDRRARDLELFGELSLRRELVTGAKIALLEETLDLLDDALVEAATTDRLDDGQGSPPKKPLVRWSDQT
jgi:hypothetical protein